MSGAADDSGRLLGLGRCIVCEARGARVVLMKTGRVCVTCNACKVQVFARGDASDELLRDKALGAVAAPVAQPAPDAAPAPAPAPKQKPEPEPEPARQGWGLAW